MANYSQLKADIAAVVKTNGEQEITGANLQQVLVQMITNSVGSGYLYKGIALTTDNPGTPDQNVFYLAAAGTYTNFGGLVIPDGSFGFLRFNGTWAADSIEFGGSDDAVLYTEQTLSEAQQTQAQANIGLAIEAREKDLSSLQESGYFNFNNNVAFSIGDIITLDVASSSRKRHLMLPVSEGEFYRVTCNGAVNRKAWLITDANNKVLDFSSVSSVTNTVIQMPSNAAKLCLNAYNNDTTITVVKMYQSQLGIKIVSQHSYNYLDLGASVSGELDSTGNVVANTSRFTTDYIPVKQGQSVATFVFDPDIAVYTALKVCFYDASKVLTQYLATNSTISIAPNDGYIRLTLGAIRKSSLVILIDDVILDASSYEWCTEYNVGVPITYQEPTKKKILAAGDSIVFGHVPSLSEYPVYGNMVQKRSFVNFACHAVGAGLRKFAISSSTIALTSTGADTFNSLVGRYQNFTDDADVVVIAAGSNDWAFPQIVLGEYTDRVNTTFYGALHNLCIGLRSKYPTQPIIFCTPIKRNGNDPDARRGPLNAEGKYMDDYCNAIKEVCGYYSIPVIDMYDECGFNAWLEADRTSYIPDGIHPENKGHRLMGGILASHLYKIGL